MTIESILLLRQSAGIDALRGWLLIILSSMILCTVWIYLVERKRRREVRREMAARFTISTRVMQEQPGAWRAEGAGNGIVRRGDY